MDITEHILFQHHLQRRMFALLDEIDPADGDALGAIWRVLARLLEVHAEAEEVLFYPELLRVGHGAGGAEDAPSETKDAIHDHNEIRDAVSRANEEKPGTPRWWKAVSDARLANSDHMAEEEREDLPDFRRHTDLRTRHDLAVRFLVFEAENAGGIDSSNKDPQNYVEDPEAHSARS